MTEISSERVAIALARLAFNLSARSAAKEAFTKLGHEADAGGGEAVRQRIVIEQKAFAPAAKAAGLGNK